jgi:signal transduction histidine kinase/AraC-like DNA-binding protein
MLHPAFKAIFSIIILQLVWLPVVIAQPSKIDSLHALLTHSPEDTNRVRILTHLAYEYLNTNPEKVKIYGEQALQLALKLNHPKSIANSYSSIGNYYFIKNIYPKAIRYYTKALEVSEKAGLKRSVASAYGNLGRVYRLMGNYALSFEYYLKDLKFSEELNQPLLLAEVNTAMGGLMDSQDRHQEALNHYLKAYQYYKQTNNKAFEAFVLNLVGLSYENLKQYDKTIEYISQALQIADSLELTRIQGHCYNTLGSTYLATQQYSQALTYYKKALEKSESKGYLSDAVEALQGIASIYMDTQREVEAVNYFQRALKLAEEQNLADGKLKIYQGLAEAHKKLGNYKLALDYQTSWIAFKDSLFNEESTKKLAHLQSDYELGKKQAEIELMQKDREREDLQRNTVGAGLVALLLIAGLIVSRQRLKIRQNRLLLEKSEEVAIKNEQLAQQAEQLKELNETKSRFFANISHEFRTPLTLILNNLLDKIVQARQQVSYNSMHELPQLQVMYRNARRLLQLINQLLDLSKLESGRMKLQVADGNLTRLMHVIYDSFASLAEVKHINFSLTLPSKELYCRYDADHIEKILYNLLSNAFKFTPELGEVNLKAELLHQEHASSLLQITVRDSGPGISPEHIGQVFDRFYQGDQSYSDEHGTGIGLALVKELVDLQGGRIWVESEKTKGALFILQLPYIPVEKQPFIIAEDSKLEALMIQNQPEDYFLTDKPIQIAQQPVEKSEEKPVVLVVEDNRDMRNYIRQHLQEQYQVIESEDGKKGLDKAFEAMPDLIISDWMMPGMNGIDLCTHLKADTRTSHIPFILLTALATDEGRLKGLETGVDDYLTKPFDSRELNLRIRNLIESRRKLRERFSRELTIEPSSITVTSADEKFLQKILKIVEDNMSDWEFSMEDFGSEVGLSRMQLHRKLKAITGKAPGDFLRLMRLKRAAQLLEMQAGNVSEVAYQVGFNNLSYFSKCFKEQYGTTPHEFISRTVTSLTR